MKKIVEFFRKIRDIDYLSDNYGKFLGKFGIFLGIVWFLIVCFFIVIQPPYENEIFIFILNKVSEIVRVLIVIIGFGIGFMGFYFARKASKAANDTIDRLTEANIIAEDAMDDFKDIFNNHLINKLKLFSEEGKEAASADISLFLSTPAYGYAVIGSDSAEFRQAISRLNKKCNLEVLLYSPDDHFTYWVNVLLWSITWKQNSELNFACIFAREIDFSIHAFYLRIASDNPSDTKTKLWIVGATTVRLFSYIPHQEQENDNKKAKKSKQLYITLTDPFSFSLKQSENGGGGAGFKARSMPVINQQLKEFVKIKSDKPEATTPFFDRLKVCPYTGYGEEKARINLENRNHLGVTEKLSADYILGRTHNQELNQEIFFSEISVFLATHEVKELIKNSYCGKEILFLVSVINEVLEYFLFVITLEVSRNHIRSKPNQVHRIAKICEELIGTSDDELLLKVTVKNKEINVKDTAETLKKQMGEIKNNDVDEEDEEIEKLFGDKDGQPLTGKPLAICFLFTLLTTGRGESEYASWRKNERV